MNIKKRNFGLVLECALLVVETLHLLVALLNMAFNYFSNAKGSLGYKV